MTNATDANPKQGFRQGPQDTDTRLDGQPIGTFSSDIHVLTAVNRVTLEQMPSGNAPATPPFPGQDSAGMSANAGDEAASLPVPAVELAAAATRLRPDPAITKALKRLLEGGWIYQDEEELVIRFEPRSKGRGKKRPSSYTTTRDSCTCPGAIIRGGCYHPIAWQIVTEAVVPTTSIQCALPATMFLPLCLLGLSSGTDQVTLGADSGQRTLTLTVPNIVTSTLTIEMTTPILLRIKQQVRATDLKRIVEALAGALFPEGEQVMLEFSVASLLVIAGAEDAPIFVDGLDALPMDSPAPS